MSGRLVVVGDALLDRDLVGTVDRLCPDAPVPVVDEPEEVSRPGGAGLAALLAARDGRDVVLVTALSQDAAGRELAALLAREGVEVVDLGLDGPTPEKVRVRAAGRSLLRLDRGSARGVPGDLTGDLPEGAGLLVADYGRGVTALPGVRAALGRRGRTPLVWDPHPRGADPVAGASLVTPNAAEAGAGGSSLAATTTRARALLAQWEAVAVAVTLGSRGALVVHGPGVPSVVPAPQVPCPDPCGAGDRFASAAAGLLADGALPSEAVRGAVLAASAFVAAGGAAAVQAPAAPPVVHGAEDAASVVARVRAAGGTVVATGGCFDLLHAGHVAVLQQARALGDCLVVCLNSDDSVRRLKGPTRPLQDQHDRALVLRGLACVDAVAVFDEDTPSRVLSELRPDVFAKGGDYALGDLPEAPVVEAWGGQAVVLPYVDGRSTTRLIEEAACRSSAPS